MKLFCAFFEISQVLDKRFLQHARETKAWSRRGETRVKNYGDETLATLEARNLEIPTTIAAAEAALSALEGQEQEVILKLEHFHKLRAEVDQLVEVLYQPKPGKP